MPAVPRTELIIVFICYILFVLWIIVLYFIVYAFMLLCFVFRCSIGNIVTTSSYHGRPARWTSFWQPAYRLHLMCTLLFSIVLCYVPCYCSLELTLRCMGVGGRRVGAAYMGWQRQHSSSSSSSSNFFNKKLSCATHHHHHHHHHQFICHKSKHS